MPRGVYERKGKKGDELVTLTCEEPKAPASPSGEIQPGVTQEGGVITIQPGATFTMTIEDDLRASQPNSKLRPLTPEESAQRETELAAARTCAGCVAFEPGDDKDAYGNLRGLCHFMPAAVSVHEGHHCRQWEGRK